MKKSEVFDYEKYLSSKSSSKSDAAQDPAENAEAQDKKNRPLKPKKKPELSDSIISALDEDVAEIAEFSVTKGIEEEPVLKKNSFKRSLYFVLGVVVSFMSLIGFISSVSFCANVISGIADNTKQKEAFADLIYPVVIVDPAPYTETSQLTSDMVIAAAIWDIILHEDVSKYPEEFGTMTIPQLDVEQHATSLFGSGLTFEHKTLGDAALSFYYTEESKSYNVPVSPKYFPYSPRVENIKREGDVYILRVGYISPSPAWLIQSKNFKTEADKFMSYTLKKNGNSYTVTGITEINDGTVPPGDL